MYAIVKTGGKQYRVERGQRLLVERLPADEGADVALAARSRDQLEAVAEEVRQLGRQAHVFEYQAGLRSKVKQELFLDRSERLTLALAHRQSAQQLALVSNLDGALGAWKVGQRFAGNGGRVGGRGRVGPAPRDLAGQR